MTAWTTTLLKRYHRAKRWLHVLRILLAILTAFYNLLQRKVFIF